MIQTILDNFHLEKIIWIVKKKLAFMIIFAMIGGILGGVFSYMTNQNYYQAKISFYVYSNPDYKYDSSVNISNTEFTLAKNLVKSYTQVLKSDTVLQMVIDETGLPYTTEMLVSAIGYSVVPDTALFYVTVYDGNPYNAMMLANAIADIAPDEIARIVKTGGIEVVDYAKLPTMPYSSSSLIKFVLLGVLGAGGLSAVLFLFFGLLDTTIRRKYEIKLAFTLPVLGEVPLLLDESKKKKAKKILDENSPFALKESYNNLRANLLYLGKGEKCPVFAVTSAEQEDGKTLNSINISISLAQLGKKVLLIDGDMRNPSVGRSVGLEEGNGLSQYLARITDKKNIINYSDNLDLFVAGEIPPNPSELLAGTNMDELLTEAKEQYDFIIIDLPPVGIVSDALVLAKKVTAYIMVIRAGHSKMTTEKNAVLALELVEANISGFVFNGIDPKSQDYTYRKYKSSYQYGSKKK